MHHVALLSSLPHAAAWNAELTAFTAFLSEHLLRSPGTVKQRRSHIRRLAQWLGDSPSPVGPWQVRTPQLVAWTSSLTDCGPEARKNARSSLRSFWRWGLLTERTSHDPTRLMPLIRIPVGVPRPMPDPLISAALVGAADRERLMVLLAAHLGLRASEIAVVRHDDLWEGYGAHASATLLVHGKGGHQRTVPVVHPEVLAALRGARRNPGRWLITGRVDGHISAAHVSRLLSRLLPEDWTGHKLRHRAGTTAYDVTGDIRATQAFLGHARVTTTERYTLVSARALAGVAAATAVLR